MEEGPREPNSTSTDNPYEDIGGGSADNYDKLEMYENTRGHNVYTSLHD